MPRIIPNDIFTDAYMDQLYASFGHPQYAAPITKEHIAGVLTQAVNTTVNQLNMFNQSAPPVPGSIKNDFVAHIFHADYIDGIYNKLSNGRFTPAIAKEDIADALSLAVGTASAQLSILFPSTNPTQLSCDMKHNPHNFIDRGQAKRCGNTSCNCVYCDKHAITNCVNCGTRL